MARRMNREVHVRICGRLGMKFPRGRLSNSGLMQCSGQRLHSITSSASARSLSGTSNPSFSGLEVDHEFEFGRPHYWQIGRCDPRLLADLDKLYSRGLSERSKIGAGVPRWKGTRSSGAANSNPRREGKPLMFSRSASTSASTRVILRPIKVVAKSGRMCSRASVSTS